jgi:uncharacterized membrane protein (UPF0127 family)
LRIKRLILLVSLLAGLIIQPLPIHAESLTYDTVLVEFTGETGTIKSRLTVRVADNYLKKYIGLRNAQSLDTGTGMIFVYERAAQRNFTMRDMSIPLDIIFIEGNRRIGSIHSVRPGVETVQSNGDARWVVETQLGWARRHSIESGDRMQIKR